MAVVVAVAVAVPPGQVFSGAQASAIQHFPVAVAVAVPPGQVVMGAQSGATQQRLDQIFFEQKEYDVTDWCEKCSGGSTKLILEPEQLVILITRLNSSNETKAPYGEVGAVDRTQNCGATTTNVLGHDIDPGCWGNMSAMVEEIVEEMNRRIAPQTKLALTQRSEHHFDVTLGTANKVLGLELKMDLVLSHLGVAQEASAPSQVLMQANARDKEQTVFERKEYDIADPWETCGGTRRKLILEPEQVVILTTKRNFRSEQKVPYGEVGAVDRYEANGKVTTNVLGQDINPYVCGMQNDNVARMVGEIVEELNRRIASQTKLRLTQLAQQHLDISFDLNDRTSSLEARIELILGKLGVQAPCTSG